MPNLSYDAPPTKPSFILKLIFLFLASQSTTLNVSFTTSGPTPSPGKIINVLLDDIVISYSLKLIITKDVQIPFLIQNPQSF